MRRSRACAFLAGGVIAASWWWAAAPRAAHAQDGEVPPAGAEGGDAGAPTEPPPAEPPPAEPLPAGEPEPAASEPPPAEPAPATADGAAASTEAEPSPTEPAPEDTGKEKAKARWIELRAPSLSGLGGFGHLITPDAMKGIRAGVAFVYSELDADRRGLTLENEHARWEAFGAFGFGLGEVAVRVPVYERRRDDTNAGGQTDDESFGDIELSAKIGVPLGIVAVGGYLRIDIATGDDNEGLGAMREPFPARQSNEAFGTELELGGSLALRPFKEGELGKVAFLANLGVTWAEGAEFTFLYRLGLSYAATDALRFVAYWDGEEHESVVEHRGSVTLGLQAGIAEAAFVSMGLTFLADDEFAQGAGLDDVKQLGFFLAVGAAF